MVCGAPNVRAGMKAPLARVGARLPSLRSRRRTARRENEGMLCSARELGLSDDHSGLLEIDGKPGSDARAALRLDDHVLTLKLTPNRADCLSVLGLRASSPRSPARRSSRRRSSRFQPEQGAPRGEAADARGLRPLRRRGDPGVNAKAPTPDWMRSGWSARATLDRRWSTSRTT